MSRAFTLMLAGGFGALIAWAFMEPSAPRVLDAEKWSRWELMMGVALGAMIGLMLGVASGFLQGSKGHALKGLVLGAILGAMSGGIGITLGSAIYAMGSKTMPFFSEAFRVMGWSLMGLLVGLGQGVTGWSLKRSFYGLVGGFIGGLIGGWAFVVVGTLTAPMALAVEQSGEVGTIPRAIGFTLIGASIGLLIGVVEAVAKQASVRLILGRNEGKEWPIFDDNFTIGRSEMAHAPLFGDNNVAPIHAVVQRHKGQYFLAAVHPVTAVLLNGQPVQQAALASGDTFQLGTHTLQFITAGAQKRVQSPDIIRAATHFGQNPVQVQHPQGAGSATMAMPPQATIGFPAPAASATLRCTVIAGPLLGQSFEVSGPLQLGREVGPLSLGVDHMVSRRHVALSPTPDGLSLTDLGSKNGTMIQNSPITNHVLPRGGTFQIGQTVIRVD